MGGLGLLMRRRAIQAHPTAGSDYIKFADEAVFNVLMSKGVSSDGIGITKEDAARVTTIGSWFSGNALIKNFNEFQYFVNVTQLGYTAFMNCSSLESIVLPMSMTSLPNLSAFNGCVSLSAINLGGLGYIGMNSFFKCSGLIGDLILPSCTEIEGGAFSFTGYSRILDLGSCAKIGKSRTEDNGSFRRCDNLTLAILPKTMQLSGWAIFYQCASLTTLICKGETPFQMNYNNFLLDTPIKNGKGYIYVPDNAVDAYKTASNWSTYSNQIKGISQFPTDNPSLYAEIKQYL